MKVKEVVRGEHKWIVYKTGEDRYTIEFYEFYPSINEWRKLSQETNYTAEAIKFQLGISV